MTTGVDLRSEEGSGGYLPVRLFPGHSAGVQSSIYYPDDTLVSAGAVGRRNNQQDQGPLRVPAGELMART